MDSKTSTTNGVAVRVTGITKTYRRRRKVIHALSETNIDFNPGEFISLIGPSGCGKSTLLKIVAGLLPATSGQVFLGDKEVREPSSGASVAFQKPTLLPWRSVLNNIILPTQIDKARPQAEVLEHANELIKLMGLEDFANHYPRELSGGMEQRAAIARSLISKPQLLLMDEPFGALDEFTREDLNNELLNLWQREPKTVLFVTHSISEAVFLSDRIVVMKARPGAIHDVIPVDLPRPRDPEVRNSEEFYSLVRDVRISLEEAKGLRPARSETLQEIR